MTFEAYPTVARLRRDCTITEKIDGTNAQVFIQTEADYVDAGPEAGPSVSRMDVNGETFYVQAGSRKRWLTYTADNFGFAKWVCDHTLDLVRVLGVGRHYGEWWGQGIQRKYGLDHKRFSLFNTGKWQEYKPASSGDINVFDTRDMAPECCHVVPVLYKGTFYDDDIETAAGLLSNRGSFAAPDWDGQPEGIMIWHHAARVQMKWTFGGDGHKS